MALSKTTKNHEEILRWAESRGAAPAEVASTHREGEPGILRFCFPRAQNQKNQNLCEISWDEFFQKFDDNNLELVYQEKTATGRKSNFNKLVHRGNAKDRKKSSSGRKATSSHSERSAA